MLDIRRYLLRSAFFLTRPFSKKEATEPGMDSPQNSRGALVDGHPSSRLHFLISTRVIDRRTWGRTKPQDPPCTKKVSNPRRQISSIMWGQRGREMNLDLFSSAPTGNRTLTTHLAGIWEGLMRHKARCSAESYYHLTEGKIPLLPANKTADLMRCEYF